MAGGLKELCAGLGIHIPENIHDTVELEIEGTYRIDLDLRPEESQLGISAWVGEWNQSQEVLCEIVSANYLAYETRGCSLGLDFDSREIRLCRVERLDNLSPESLKHAIELFLRDVDYWKTKLDEVMKENGDPGPVRGDLA